MHGNDNNELFGIIEKIQVVKITKIVEIFFQSYNQRSKLGQMILVISHIQELLHINQLHVLK